MKIALGIAIINFVLVSVLGWFTSDKPSDFWMMAVAVQGVIIVLAVAVALLVLGILLIAGEI